MTKKISIFKIFPKVCCVNFNGLGTSVAIDIKSTHVYNAREFVCHFGIYSIACVQTSPISFVARGKVKTPDQIQKEGNKYEEFPETI